MCVVQQPGVPIHGRLAISVVVGVIGTEAGFQCGVIIVVIRVEGHGGQRVMKAVLLAVAVEALCGKAGSDFARVIAVVHRVWN